VTTAGVVTAVRGSTFYLQDVTPDGVEATSQGVRVLAEDLPEVGDEVTVTGVVAERRPGCGARCTARDPDFAGLAVTTLEQAAVRIRAHGRALPAPVIVGRRGRPPPDQVIDGQTGGDVEEGGRLAPARRGLDFYESLEGMRVQVDDPLVVGPTRRGAGATELVVVGDGGTRAGPRTARGGLGIRGDDFNPERIFVAGGIAGALPAASVGDTFAGPVVGVVDYDRGHFQLLATELPALASGGLARETTSLPLPGPAELRVATLNVHNLDPGDPPARLAGLAAIVVESLHAPDLLALEEVQDDDGARRSAVVSATATVAALTAAVTRAGGPRYQWRSIDPIEGEDGGEPGGNIRIGFLFRSDRGLAFVDRPGATARTANAIAEGGQGLAFSPGRIDPGNPAFAGSRKPLAAELTFGGARLFVVAAHLVSRIGDQPLFGRFQPPALPSAPQRLAQAAVVAAFVRELLAADPRAAVLVLGDLNDFDASAPLSVLKDAGLTALSGTLPPEERYTYLFEGNSQPLDHLLVSPSLRARVSGFDIIHRDAEFATQVTDHDPCLLGIAVTP
jgi:endonuclease/exonuclease/phosphatase family metal-dependent hydrolase